MKIAIVLENTDFQTGNGEYLFHRAFINRSLAHDYIMTQEGIFGSEQRFVDVHQGVYNYNGYTIQVVHLHNKVLSQEKIEELKKELKQITARQEEIKKLLK